ncbi:MAG: flagellar transcriptional regulator FlhD [Castellaniella sp.]|uniref:flagellar transcriptional regulator FlhD n=1 Tax=Castellaniella sp. TaxID=1955812 RepID=UPI00121AA534|nr:flagellar transcriptional regulator FlhD [Castellaniella sp.]TAN27694.1 MAG: flagellar transcriptional regulator FlhD [Castellaniella sp.]
MFNLDSALLDDIREVNLSYLMLAQRLLRESLPAGMFRLGFSADVADIVLNLSPAQIVKLAGSNSVLCAFRLNDAQLLASLTHEVLGGVLQQAHSTILMARHEPISA